MVLDDSNVIGRKGIAYLQESQSFAEKVLQTGAMRTESGRALIEKYDQWCIKERISHGGAADLMAVVLFFYFINL
jgi:triphosphoribosyl-dephospho-CoA synthetase